MKNRDAVNLGVCRALLYGFAAIYYGPIDFTLWAGVPAVFWRPMALFRVLRLDAPSYELLLLLQWIWRCSLILSCIGLYTRAATLVAGAAGLYLIALPNNFGNVHRVDAAFVLGLLVMALTRSGDAWSLDARHGRSSALVGRFEYRWPVMAVRVLLALSIFAAGFAKLRRRGLEWITTDSLAILLGEQVRLLEEPLLPSVTLWLVSHSLLCSVTAGGIVALEILYPVALISRRARLLLIPGTVLTILLFRALVGPGFYPLIALQLFWVDWPAVLAGACRGESVLNSKEQQMSGRSAAW